MMVDKEYQGTGTIKKVAIFPVVHDDKTRKWIADAMAHIDTLEAQLNVTRKALEPFAIAYKTVHFGLGASGETWLKDLPALGGLLVSDLHAAAEVFYEEQ